MHINNMSLDIISEQDEDGEKNITWSAYLDFNKISEQALTFYAEDQYGNQTQFDIEADMITAKNAETLCTRS